MLNIDSTDYLAYVRNSPADRQSCLVNLNFSDQVQSVCADVQTDALRLLFSSHARPAQVEAPGAIELRPYEVLIAELE